MDASAPVRPPSAAHVSVADLLRAAIARRSDLRPGSRAHWANECEIRVLQSRLARDLDGVTARPLGDVTALT